MTDTKLREAARALVDFVYLGHKTRTKRGDDDFVRDLRAALDEPPEQAPEPVKLTPTPASWEPQPPPAEHPERYAAESPEQAPEPTEGDLCDLVEDELRRAQQAGLLGDYALARKLRDRAIEHIAKALATARAQREPARTSECGNVTLHSGPEKYEPAAADDGRGQNDPLL